MSLGDWHQALIVLAKAFSSVDNPGSVSFFSARYARNYPTLTFEAYKWEFWEKIKRLRISFTIRSVSLDDVITGG